MHNKFKRAIDHLTKGTHPEFVLKSLEAVRDLFGEEWLTSNGEHRLQLLWRRPDHVATSELYAFGKAILKLSETNQTWLESTAKDIKKNIDTSHGLITEIIKIGSLSPGESGGIIKPCPKSYKTYDYRVEFDSGYGYKVSIKNFDISVHEKEFKKHSTIIRKTFLNMLKGKNRSGRLTIVCEHDTLTKEITKNICEFIVFNIDDYNSYLLYEGRIFIRFHPLSEYENESLVNPSDTVLIFAKQHHNEQRNVEYKIHKANESLFKDSDDDKNIKQLTIRLGASTDFNRMKKYIEKIASDTARCGFDLCEIYQPVLTSNDKVTKISTTINIISRGEVLEGGSSFLPLNEGQSIVNKLKNIKPLIYDLGIGSLLFEPIPYSLFVDKNQIAMDLSTYYTYQKGDIYIRVKKDVSGYYGELNQLAPGILEHSVFGNIKIESIVYPSNDQLLIV
ncbi:hypothetical protein [Vibrio fluvialis]|uniref:hypothetical protein n=1 Tax=Vibrio fluvialis TaxID=676 RepID=UPI001121D53B|nr:hypothetical protein [Vibrio fluvialis]TOY91861.1 hypothetical protein DJ016_18450 [Vibrio fluvialis]TRN10040.1 hypothetical protein DM587_16875 [Vibrio fluvialis]